MSCNRSQRYKPIVEVLESVEYPVGYITKSISTGIYDITELAPIQEDFLENFLQKSMQYEGTHPVMDYQFPEKWGIAVVERLSEGRELYQIQSQNREWIFLVITSGYGTQRILDILPVAADLSFQSLDILETEIWKTDREIDGTFAVSKKYEWKRSLENITQDEYEENPRDYFRTQTMTDRYFINELCRFEIIKTENVPDYQAVVFYYKEEKPTDWLEVVPNLQAFAEDYEILVAEAKNNFTQVPLFDYKLNFITNVDISEFMDLHEGIIFMKKGETPKTVPFGSYERLKIEMKRYFKIIEV